MSDRVELRRLAEAAAPGPYHAVGSAVWRDGGGTVYHWTEADAAYLAAVDPQTVLALLGEVDALRAQNDRELIALFWSAKNEVLRAEVARLHCFVEALERWLDDGDWQDGVDGVVDWADEHVASPAVALICAHLGHEPIPDHCGRPEHDLCLRCQAPTPGEAAR